MSVHGFFAFGLETVDNDKIAVGAFEHERRGSRVDAGGFAENVGDAQDVSFENDAGSAKKSVFGLREALVGDNLAKNILSGKIFWA